MSFRELRKDYEILLSPGNGVMFIKEISLAINSEMKSILSNRFVHMNMFQTKFSKSREITFNK